MEGDGGDPRGLYAVLQLPRHASAACIRRAYRGLVLRLHPDKCGMDRDRAAAPAAAAERFHLVQTAYAVLSDPVQRAAYDAMGRACTPNTRGPSPPIPTPTTHTPPEPSMLAVEVSARDVRLGRPAFRVEAMLDVSCPACSSRRMCKGCSGRGTVVHRWGGDIVVTLTCIMCAGTGLHHAGCLGCQTCGDAGIVRTPRVLRVDVPRGVRNSDTMILRGQGSFDPTTRMQRDLCLRFERVFPPGTSVLDEREGSVEIRVPLTLGACLTGFERLDVDVLGRAVCLRARSGYFDPSRPLLLQGRGLPGEGGDRKEGDAVLRFEVVWPDPVLSSSRVGRNLARFRPVLRKIMCVDDDANGTPAVAGEIVDVPIISSATS